MRSELVNYLQIKSSSKVLLRACIEFHKKYRCRIDDNNKVFLNTAFAMSSLHFGEGLEAMEELQQLQILEYRVTAKDLPTLCYSTLWKFIKTTMEDIEVNQMGTIPIVDYNEICSLIEQKEAGCLVKQPVS